MKQSITKFCKMQNFLIVLILLWAMLCTTSFEWPDDGELLTEFSGTDSIVQFSNNVPYMVFNEGAALHPPSGTMVFQGRLPNGLGDIQVFSIENRFLYLYGKANTSSALNGASSRTVIILDALQRRIINPEILLENPEKNTAPALRKLTIFRNPVPDPNAEPEADSDAELIKVLYPWNSGNVLRINSGEYFLSIDWVDGRRSFADVENLYSILLYMNGELAYQQGIMYFQEQQNSLELVPGFHGDITSISFMIKPGKNLLELYLQDPKGLSARYDFFITGESIPTAE
ncbi:MAG: hypothetical protein ACR2PY_04395 [Salinispira sp.]